jgi:hypothetical protein
VPRALVLPFRKVERDAGQRPTGLPREIRIMLPNRAQHPAHLRVSCSIREIIKAI